MKGILVAIVIIALGLLALVVGGITGQYKMTTVITICFVIWIVGVIIGALGKHRWRQ